MKEEDDRRKMEELHQHRVNQMIKSTEGRDTQTLATSLIQIRFFIS